MAWNKQYASITQRSWFARHFNADLSDAEKDVRTTFKERLKAIAGNKQLFGAMQTNDRAKALLAEAGRLGRDEKPDYDTALDCLKLAEWQIERASLHSKATQGKISADDLTNTVAPELQRQAAVLMSSPTMPPEERRARMLELASDFAMFIDLAGDKAPAAAVAMGQQYLTLLKHPSASPPPDDRDELEIGEDANEAREKANAQTVTRRRKMLEIGIKSLTKAVAKATPNSPEQLELLEQKTKAETELKFAGMTSDDPYRAALFQETARGAMIKLDDTIDRIVPAEHRQALKDKLGTKLNSIVDEMVREAVYHHVPKGESYGKAMDRLLGGTPPGDALFKQFPGLQEMINHECKQFTDNINGVLGQVESDQKELADDLFKTKIKGLKDITVADSDPHNGGKRVVILAFEGDDGKTHRVVNKPRDVRVDAKFVGKTGKTGKDASAAERSTELMRWAAAKKRQKLKDPMADPKSWTDIDKEIVEEVERDIKPLATYQFIPKEDEDGHPYGWVEFVEHGRPEDCILDEAKTKEYYKQMGQLSAMSFLFGIEDVHQGNVMVRNGQPVLTDLEIAFSSKNVEDINSTDPVVLKRYIANKMSATMVNKGIGQGSQNKTMPTSMVVNDQIVERSTNDPLKEITENFVALEKDGELTTQDEGLGSMFKDDLLEGFEQLLEAFGDPDMEDENDEFIDGFAGMHVRYHAIATATQMGTRRNAMRNGYKTSIDEESERLKEVYEGGDFGRRIEKDPKLGEFPEIIGKDLAKRDVAYFTQELGTKKVLHNGTTPIKHSGSEDMLRTDGLSIAKKNLALLRDPEMIKEIKAQGKKTFENLSKGDDKSPTKQHKKKMQEELEKSRTI